MNYITFVFCIIILLTHFSPRVMTQTLPYILFILVLIKLNNKEFYKVPDLLKILIFPLLFISVLSLLINNFYLPNFFIGWYTFFSGFLVLIISYSFYDRIDIKKITNFIIILSLIQIPIGLFQVFQASGMTSLIKYIFNSLTFVGSGMGDFFTGTYFAPGKTSHILSAKLIISFFLVLFFKESNFFNKNRTIIASLLFIAIILGENNHIIICFLLAIAIYLLYYNFFITKQFTNLVIAVIVISMFFVFIVTYGSKSIAIQYPLGFIERAISVGNFNYYDYLIVPRKILSFFETIFLLPHYSILNIIFGVGIGNYSSYAAQTGVWDIVPQSLYQLEYPKEFWQIIYPKWNLFLLSQPYKDGNANMPWFTYQTILAEFGYIGLFLFLLFWIRIIRSLRIALSQKYNNNKSLSKFILITTFFLLFTFFFDNYHEDPRITIVYFTYLGYYFGYNQSKKTSF